MPPMWTASAESLDGDRVRKTAIHRDGAVLRYGDAVALLQSDQDFRAFFISLLRAAPFSAYLWECPPVVDAKADRPFEFVLTESPPLARMAADAEAFASHFEAGDASDGIATFWNLGRDALLVAPCPRAPSSAYAHLAAFARKALEEQQHALWRAVGAAVMRQLSGRPLWLSTSGLGVAWLHVRLDSRPKYYSYAPYRKRP